MYMYSKRYNFRAEFISFSDMMNFAPGILRMGFDSENS